MNATKPVLALGVIAAIYASACGGNEQQAVIAVAEDSAGVRIVTSQAPLWRAGDAWSTDSAAIHIPPEVSDSLYLYGVVDLVRLTDGRFVVANRGTSQLLFFSARGEFHAVAGRKGDGPGEFDGIDRLLTCAGDTLVVAERRRVSIHDADGRHVRTVSIGQKNASGYQSVEGVSTDCSAVLVLQRATIAPPMPPGRYDQRHTLFWSSLETNARDTVATFSGPDAAVLDYARILYPRAVPWGARTVWHTADDQVYLGHGRAFELEVHDRHGRLRQITRWNGTRSPVSSADRELYHQRRQQYVAGSSGGSPTTPPLTVFPFLPDEMPAYSRVLRDSDGNVWIQDYDASAGGRPGIFESGGEDRDQFWQVVDSTGQHLGRIAMSKDLEVLGFAGPYLAAVRRDSVDLEHVLLLPVVRE